ncbi:ATP-dependent DNA helicase HFM1 [Pelomyxa schiedti]|nr:ATP-dependent DNA helicase HFM1 [Pelomyxa schiedti]
MSSSDDFSDLSLSPDPPTKAVCEGPHKQKCVIQHNASQDQLHSRRVLSTSSSVSPISAPKLCTPRINPVSIHNTHCAAQTRPTNSVPSTLSTPRPRQSKFLAQLFSKPLVDKSPSPAVTNPNQLITCSNIGNLPVSAVGTRFEPLFSPHKFFNKVQSACFDTIFNSDLNVVVSAPTASGKTMLFLLAICRLISRRPPNSPAKVIYMAPAKALCQQTFTDWKKRFSVLDPPIECKELTGDTEITDYSELSSSDIILTTPEKWDSVTRHWKDNLLFIGKIGLLLIDEVHLLASSRGATLEAVISRMKTVRSAESMCQCTVSELRFIAVSATFPNIEDISSWLGAPQNSTFWFGEEFRPVPLQIVVTGFPKSTKNEFLFDRNLIFKIPSIIEKYSNGRPVLVFCSSRKGASQTAQYLTKDTTYLKQFSIDYNRLLEVSRQTHDPTLSDCLKKGIGFHSAGSSLQDRALVEALFIDQKLAVLCTTSTLATGVNLPAHLVIIKSTVHYRHGSGYEELSQLDILQMIGRAGRPQFDSSATAVIMTSNDNKHKWESVVSRKEIIESCLIQNLKEHLVSEVVLRTITDIDFAINWLKSTYFYHRLQKNPKHYNIPPGDNPALLTRMQELCIQDLNELSSQGLIAMDDNLNIEATERGRIMASYYVSYDTMKLFSSVTIKYSYTDLLDILAHAKEFREIRLRATEKKQLSSLKVRYPVGKVTTDSHKVNTLIQAALDAVTIEDWSLKQDSSIIFSCIGRISRALISVLLERDSFEPVATAISLTQCLHARMWPESTLILRQIEGIGDSYAKSLSENGISSFSSMQEADPRKLELICNRHAPWGNQVKQALSHLPSTSIILSQAVSPVKKSAAQADLKLDYSISVGETVYPHCPCFYIMVTNNSKIVFQKKYTSRSNTTRTELLAVTRPEKGNYLYDAFLFCEQYLGLDSKFSFTVDFPDPPTPVVTLSPQTPSQPHRKIQKSMSDFVSPPTPQPVATSQETTPSITNEGADFDFLFDIDDFDLLDIPQFSVQPSSSILQQPATPSPAIQFVTDQNGVIDLDPSPPKKSFPHPPVTTPEKLKNVSVFTCKHNCKNKQTCKHDCCKRTTGKRTQAPTTPTTPTNVLAPTPKRPRTHTSIPLLPLPSETQTATATTSAKQSTSDPFLDLANIQHFFFPLNEE